MKKLKIFIAGFLATYGGLSFATNKIDDLANAFMAKNQVKGMSIAVINKNKITTYNYGYANETTHTKTSDKTIYRIASFSKPIAATLEAVAQVEGKINLDNSITNYLPELNNDQLKPITVKMLVAHTGSLPFNFNPPPQNYKEAIADLNTLKPKTAPGSQYAYSNVSIGLNGYILQNVYKQDYESILFNKISKPLGFNSTYLNLPQNLESYVALGHEDNKTRPYDRNIDIWFAAASLKSNITDMAKFVRAQFNPSLLNKNLARAFLLIHQNYYCFSNGNSCEQLGWQAHEISSLSNDIGDTFFENIDKNGNYIFGPQQIISGNSLKNKKIFIDKTCGGYGMTGYMAYIPEQKIGVVILLNKQIGKQIGDPRIRLGRDILQTIR